MSMGLTITEKNLANASHKSEVTAGEIHDKTKDITLKAKPLPKFIQKIVEKGGLVNFLRSEGYV